jgi:hypothetical protein
VQILHHLTAVYRWTIQHYFYRGRPLLQTAHSRRREQNSGTGITLEKIYVGRIKNRQHTYFILKQMYRYKNWYHLKLLGYVTYLFHKIQWCRHFWECYINLICHSGRSLF